MAILTINLEKAFETCCSLLTLDSQIDVVAPKILEIICSALNCDWGTLWKVDPEHLALFPASTWQRPHLHTEELNRDTTKRRLSLSEGNAGHVWRSRRPIWSTNLIKDMCIPRSLEAEKAGLRGGIWFALKNEVTVFGVIELLGTNLSEATSDQLLIIERFGTRLGGFIQNEENCTMRNTKI